MAFNKVKKSLILSVVPLVIAGCTIGNDPDETGSDTEQTVREVEVSDIRVNVSSEITDAVDIVEEAVVSVINLQRNNFNTWTGFYGSQVSEEEYSQAGSGSGAIYKIEGDRAYIFTNNHVVEGSDAVDILLADGTSVPAEVEGADLWTDLAVLSISSEGIETSIEFGDSENLTVGEPAIAIGSPLGTNFASSVTSGIISGIGRTVPVDTDGDGELDWEMTAIQTDAAINPGNSGGPLVNIAGQVVGINSMKISTDFVEGMGFAIPSNDAINIINQLEQDGEVTRPYLGITMIDLTYIPREQRADELNLPEEVTNGIVVTRIQNNTAAANAGLQPADVIVSFNGEPVNNSVGLRQLIYTTTVGQEVEVEYYRNGEAQVTTVEMLPAEN